MFKRISRMKSKHQIIFAILIAFAVVSFWRGILGLMDVYLFPQYYRLSLLISLFIGVSILLITNYAVKEYSK
ncbi:MAG: hypothetical protein Q8R04_03220 [Nanoarchaeota archaeon]|nr:hypothetical protein [Nanoarchaeota archaeon]